uniref:Uncharacterized protein n=1 Tax=Magnetococcus massalia (strain MO-1) TaxID=451514 RepID=A0A1S7LP99_MAGMO|nr:protein of unknown function [Candidatus Magnetococcus massalia]
MVKEEKPMVLKHSDFYLKRAIIFAALYAILAAYLVSQGISP